MKSNNLLLIPKRLILNKTKNKFHHPYHSNFLFNNSSYVYFSVNNKTTTTTDNSSMSFSLKNVINSTIDMVKNPRQTWILIKEAALHYWIGTKLLWSEIKLTNQILGRLLQGHGMTRRERMQLVRTSTDLFRLVPFSIFIIVPFMEFLLPFALRLFPNMLPSTFQDTLKKEETMKKELQMRLAIASFMQDTLKEMATKKDQQQQQGDDKTTDSAEVVEFIEKARMGQPIPNDVVIRMARLFRDELTLANVSRPQLVSMCQYMNLPPYGADMFLRFNLRTKLRAIKEDDRRILWEGIDALNTVELRDACRERGMRSTDLTQFRLRKQLQEWLDLSIQKNIPISLLIMSRALNLSSDVVTVTTADVLTSSISSLDPDIINEVVIAVASPTESKTTDMRQRKLESLEFQREMIQEEREESEEAKESIQLEKEKDENELLLLKENISSSSDNNNNNNNNNNHNLTVSEIQALSDLARGGSAVQREKAELAILQAGKEGVEEKEGGGGGGVSMLKKALDSMLDRLKIRIDVTEKELGDKFNLLDKDGDGELSSEELKEAMVKILKRTTTTRDAEELVQILDRDKDGKVSLVELLQYVESRKDVLEVEVLEAHLTSTSKEKHT